MRAANTIESMKKLRVILCAVLALLLCCTIFPSYEIYADTANAMVYVGGYPVGISLDVGGLLVENVTGVETEYGTAYVEGLCKGDIIKTIGGKSVVDVDDITDILTDDETEIDIVRDGRQIKIKVKPIAEAYTGKLRLGVKIKDKLYGVGTVCFVRADNSYAALGHEIYDGETDVHIPFAGGHIHACKVIGIKQGKKGEAGAILASLIPDKVYGTVRCNNSFGIAGEFTAEFDKSELLPLADRSEVVVGDAKIKTTVDGNAEYFDIEIIKASHQSGRKEKGLVFRVTDKRLLDKTGGVVRGMSGSPIIQNGKVIGAVTHVFLNDFTKGYGVYADCLN